MKKYLYWGDSKGICHMKAGHLSAIPKIHVVELTPALSRSVRRACAHTHTHYQIGVWSRQYQTRVWYTHTLSDRSVVHTHSDV